MHVEERIEYKVQQLTADNRELVQKPWLQSPSLHYESMQAGHFACKARAGQSRAEQGREGS